MTKKAKKQLEDLIKYLEKKMGEELWYYKLPTDLQITKCPRCGVELYDCTIDPLYTDFCCPNDKCMLCRIFNLDLGSMRDLKDALIEEDEMKKED